MKNKINKTLNLILLLSVLNGNILPMQESDIEPNTQAMAIDQDVQQELSLLGLPAEVIEYILYQIIKPYENRIKDVNNIFEFYSQIGLRQLKQDLQGALLASKDLGMWTSNLINRLLKRKYDESVKPIKDQYQGLSKDELGSRLKNIISLSQFNINIDKLEEAAKLILAGANVDEKDKCRETALILAAYYGYKGIVQLLIYNGANVDEKNNYGSTALIYAASHGHKDIVQLLIDNGANVNEKSNDGYTALMLAVEGGHKDTVQLLIDNGANINEKNNDDGDTALMLAVMDGYEGIVALLINNGANVNAGSNDKSTALIFAAEASHKDIVQLLISNGANVNEKDDDGNTALTMAANHGYKDIVELLEAIKNKENQK